MNSRWCSVPLLFLIPLLLPACQGEKEDPALIQQHKEQKAVIAELNDELRTVNQSIQKSEIADPAPDLKEVKEALNTASATLKELTAQVADLQTQKEKAVQEFEAYQEKFPVSQ